MSVKIYEPTFKTSSIGDSLSDTFLGTNKKEQIRAQNDYELQKAVNLNKYSWNVQGMLNAGINPVMNAANTGSFSNMSSVTKSSGSDVISKLLQFALFTIVGKMIK